MKKPTPLTAQLAALNRNEYFQVLERLAVEMGRISRKALSVKMQFSRGAGL